MQKVPNEPVTEVKIVCQRERCPGGYYLLEKTVNGHDAQLFESTWRHKGKRYICYSKQPGSHVIVDMSIINEGDPVTRGYTAITNAFDDPSEKAFRKHQLCIRVLPKDQATQAICDMTLVNKSKGETPPPGYYTITNDVNDLFVCFRMAPVMRYQPPATTAPGTYSYPVAPQQSVGQQWFGQPQAPGPSMPVPWQQQNMQSFPNYTPHHAMPAAKMSAQTGIEGLPFQINSKFDILWKKSTPNVTAAVPKMSTQDIKLKYCYDFTQERHFMAG
ncbi:multivesicular body subunit 12B [Exaiptasia diaphana]|uniref:MABP domain-containing protein n=1 Tax=Exaiptasia diaphana TaxID=2652724 RepID=A0A913WZH3_EXADI|nr:multivesicular body subunit 12B [Exaiptasia diaphana]KXJ16633.1 Multivesicular body subunit 12B [Exaiptasia diaphana]